MSAVAAAAASDDLSAFVERGGDGTASLNLLVNDVHCARCIATIESAMRAERGVLDARVNLTARRLFLRWSDGDADPGTLVGRLDRLGYPAVPYSPAALSGAGRREQAVLLRALAVAGFAAGNVMLLSAAVWAGGSSGMADSTRALLHWISALIALPAMAYAGLPFFRSAAGALAARRLDMDLPISVAVCVTGAISLFELLAERPDVYFDAALMLLFFLLIGRYLDVRTRGAMRSTAENLAALSARPATVLRPDGVRELVPAHAVAPGSRVLVAAGERIPVDGDILSGRTTIDRSLLTGEATPETALPGDRVHAGTVNIGDPVTLTATAAGDGTVLNEIVRLAEAAEQGRSAHMRLADRAARLYAPIVHSLALLAFAGWWGLGGLPPRDALLIAVSVLIITCPCALGLAVPAVQVVACNRLLKRGVLVKAGDALERLAAVDTVLLDKTGTVTFGRPEIVGRDALSEDDLAMAASLAGASRHPLCRSVSRAAGPVPVREGVREETAMGLAADTPEGEIRLGNRAWCSVSGAGGDVPDGPELWLRRPGGEPVRIRFADRLRPDAADFAGWLRERGFGVELFSGDRTPAVRSAAQSLGIDAWKAEASPADKLARLDALRRSGHRVLMVGDGLNDAPTLAGADASISPAAGADLAQTAADIVFQGDRLESVALAIRVARRAKRLVLQNFALAAGYNALAIPLAVAGHVTPLIAAAAMSASSIAVTVNALRLGRTGGSSFE
ncbi:MAG: heavy metal translocating P-type ATPase [Alphaproteobacteria bacterium]|nr:heavy metal translocating P-type ATPase [Alphaproteobacteria bacterium]